MLHHVKHLAGTQFVLVGDFDDTSGRNVIEGGVLGCAESCEDHENESEDQTQDGKQTHNVVDLSLSHATIALVIPLRKEGVLERKHLLLFGSCCVVVSQ